MALLGDNAGHDLTKSGVIGWYILILLPMTKKFVTKNRYGSDAKYSFPNKISRSGKTSRPAHSGSFFIHRQLVCLPENKLGCQV